MCIVGGWNSFMVKARSGCCHKAFVYVVSVGFSDFSWHFLLLGFDKRFELKFFEKLPPQDRFDWLWEHWDTKGEWEVWLAAFKTWGSRFLVSCWATSRLSWDISRLVDLFSPDQEQLVDWVGLPVNPRATSRLVYPGLNLCKIWCCLNPFL